MKLERGIMELLFNDIDPQLIINYLSDIHFDTEKMLNFNVFYRSSIDRFKNYSMDEIEKIYIGLEKTLDFNDPGTFFSFLGKFMGTILTYNEYEPKIKYEKLMRWNKSSHLLGQDLLTMSYLAYHDYKYSDWTEFFGYKSIISTDNRQLHNILQFGLAENHFHLKGSTQVFCLNWISIMNYPFNRKLDFKNLTISLDPFYEFVRIDKLNLYELIKIAAILRMYFFKRTTNYSLQRKGKQSLFESYNELRCIDRNLKNKDRITLYDEGNNKLKLLKSIINYRNDQTLDYALLGDASVVNNTSTFALVGERKILYTSIFMILKKEYSLIERQYFYLYILIKNMFRRELIQVNSLYGFSNFSDYERRKELFIEQYPKYKDELIRMAVNETIADQSIVSLEARIAPKNNAIENERYIQYLDKLCEKYKDKIFYVYHFIKREEPISKGNYNNCRNYYVRRHIEYQAKCLAESLKNNSYFRERVKGIDACNNEFFCRPEVFGQVFRFLSNLHIKSRENINQTPIEIFKTYHVGEDFLDIVDGLRAIDEAILFCDLRYGSRLGHAMALGLDVERYYEKKDRIIMTKQDFVDNICWLLSKADELNIDKSKYPCCKVIKEECYKIMDELYNRYYTIDDYYYSWKLRGDNPLCYVQNELKRDNIFFKKFDYYNINDRIEDEYRTKNAQDLYYLYHYSTIAKEKGKEVYDFKIIPDYIKLVNEVQNKMQFQIARDGIFIECNPTSNYLISKLRRYEDHPIIRFYNSELYHEKDELCAQINVSINTDDQGVFDTSLENEYALMAYALENYKGENGFVYNSSDIYKWIDSIRKMGLQQKFR